MSADVKVIAEGNYSVVAKPRVIPLYTTDNYATITAAGYLNSISVNKFLASDFICAFYGTGINAWFGITIDSAGVITMAPISNPGEVSLIGTAVDGNLTMFSGTTGDITDSTIPAANVLATTTDVTDYQQAVSLCNILIASVGTWTRTRVAQADYTLRHTAADDTSVIGWDITPAIRAAALRGFKLASFDLSYKIGTAALDAHTVTLDRVAYANNVANAVVSVPLTGSLATATQAQPYLSNVAVTTPAFDTTADSKYVLELTVNAAATSAYDLNSLVLRFTKSVA